MFDRIRAYMKVQRLAAKQKGMGTIETVVYLVIALFVAAILLPPALTQIYSASTTGWNSATVTVFQVLLPILAVIAIALYFIPKVRGRE